MSPITTWTWSSLLWLCGLTTIGLQALTFLIAYYLQFDKITDISGATNFVLLAWLSYVLGGLPKSDDENESTSFHRFPRQTINTLLVTLWGIRLGGYLLARVLRRGHDARFDEMRANFVKFGFFFVFQAVWVFVVMLGVVLLNATKEDVPVGVRDYVGWIFWGAGFVIEVLADQSKDAFMVRSSTQTQPQEQQQQQQAPPRRIIMTGVWSWSRHPNYFGEILLWFGLFLSCTVAFDAPNKLKGAYVGAFLSPLFTFLILMLLSGAPLAEERYNVRHGREEWYLQYRRQTSPLVPFPPVLYAAAPMWVKRVCFFEWEMYEKGLPSSSSDSGLGGNVLPSPTNKTRMIDERGGAGGGSSRV